MEKFFKLKESGTNVRTEIMAGLTTFFTMVYVIFVNPSILSLTGMPFDAVYVATILAAVIGTLIMGLFANVPYALAPGMGLNAFFTYTVCFGLGFQWQEALAIVFFCGLINIFITVTKIRKSIIKSIPKSLQYAISGGIGMFIAYIGVKNAGFLSFTADAPGILSILTKPGAPSSIPADQLVQHVGTVVTDASIVPELANFTNPAAVLALIGLVITIVLLVLKVKGSILIGIIATTIIGIPMGVTDISAITNFSASSWVSSITSVKETAFVIFGSPGLGSLFTDPQKIFLVLVTTFAFSLSDTFDTIGTFIGTGRKSGIFDEADEKALEEGNGFASKMDKALFADSIATSLGAMLGTSNTTTYVESATGIEAGGRTGLTAVVTAALFLISLVAAPFVGIVPSAATAPALIVIGIMMMDSMAYINWHDFEEATPAFLTLIIMAYAYNISYGIAAGFIFYCIIKLVTGKGKEVHPILYGSTLLFLLNFVIMALDIF